MNFHSRTIFWIGIVAVSTGVALHLPMYVNASKMHYMMAGMSMDPAMRIGMGLILAGFVLAAYGIIPHRAVADPERAAGIRVAALDDAPIKWSHVALLVVMAAAVTIDVMKPTTLAFVMPGMSKEYDLKSAVNPHGHGAVAWLPVWALSGMVVGSGIWGWLGDRIGRRASILISGVMFIGTSICGAMPSFHWNLVMCFLMGTAVGGMLPIAFALLAETIPARHRSWLMVLIGGDVAGAYVLTSFLASHLEPHYSWRIMWLIGLPSGIFIILLNRWVPESPRFLIATGREAEAHTIMERFGARIIPAPAGGDPESAAEQAHYPLSRLFRPPLTGLTVGIAMFGIGWGLVNNGFLLWLPTNLQAVGFSSKAASSLLSQSALIGLPVVFVVALLYGFWSSKKTMVIFAGLNAAGLIAFAFLGNSIHGHPLAIRALIILILISTSSILAMLTPYSSEVYPTFIRARGTGFAGICARGGGLFGVISVVTGITPPSLTGAALLGAVPVIFAMLAIARFGVETRRRTLEEITVAEGVTAAAIAD
jgi:MFS transporter, putative metabolite:H+ symporter